MSLVSFALRLVVTRMLRDRTWARDMIFNSPVDPLSEWKGRVGEGESLPCIAIYSGKRTPEVTGKATQGTSATIEIVFDILLPPTPIVVDDTLELTTNNTGAAAVMDFIWRQIEAALRAGPTPWHQVWDKFVIGVLAIESRPLLYQIEAGNSVPCLEVTMRLKTVPDPDFGVPLLSGWQILHDAMLSDDDYQSLAPLVAQHIQNPDGLPSWRQAQAALGLPHAAVAGIGIAPADPTEAQEPAVVSGVTFTDADRRS